MSKPMHTISRREFLSMSAGGTAASIMGLSRTFDAWMKHVDDRGIEGEKEALKYFDPKNRAKWPKLSKGSLVQQCERLI